MLEKIKQRLHSLIDKKFNPEQFFKEYSNNSCDQFIGVRMPDIRICAAELKDLNLDEHRDIFVELLNSPINEERMLALVMLTSLYSKNRNQVYQFYVDHVECISNWNLVDVSARDIIGLHYLKYPEVEGKIWQLARSSNFWVQRVAMVSTWAPVRKGRYDLTLKLAKELMAHKHDMVAKAVGWMVREIGKKDIDIMMQFLEENCTKMNRVALRNILEAVAKEDRKEYLSR